MLKVFAYLTKREGLATQEFIDYYENHHVPLVLGLASAPPLVYKRNYLVRGDEFNREDDAIDFDVVTELVFSDRSGFIQWIEDLSVDAVGTDEEKFLDRSRTRAYVIEERATGA
jgi:EthD domain